jgi:hypothetical protein
VADITTGFPAAAIPVPNAGVDFDAIGLWKPAATTAAVMTYDLHVMMDSSFVPD